MAATWYLNDFDLSTLGIVTLDVPEWNRAPARTIEEFALPKQSGVLLGSTATGQAGELAPTFYYRASSLSDRLSKENILKELIGAGLVKIGVNDGVTATRITYGIQKKPPVVAVQGHFVTGLIYKMSCAFLCPDAAWTSPAWSGINVAAINTPVAIPLGTHTSPWIIRATSTSNPFTITLRRLGGQVIQTITLAVATTSAEYVDIDGVRRTMEKVSGGTRTTVAGASTWTAGDWLVLDPMDGGLYSLTGGSPTLEISSGSMEVLYLKRWR